MGFATVREGGSALGVFDEGLEVHGDNIAKRYPAVNSVLLLAGNSTLLEHSGMTLSANEIRRNNFTSAVIMHLEDLGFCGRGEGGPFVENGRLAPGGALPAMTSGGGLSYNHPGMLGLLLLVEAVRQLRGEAGERQVANARIGVVHGIGGVSHGSAATVVLARD